MTNGLENIKQNTEPVSSFAWGQYRIWAATSREIKSKFTKWQFRVLILFLAGAIFGTLSEQLSAFDSTISHLFGFLSALSLGLAAFYSKEVLGGTRYKTWIRARSAAESLKSHVYLFLTNVPPYNHNNRNKILLNKVDEINKNVEDITAKALTEGEKRNRFPSTSLSVEDYINIRVNDQINNYYNPKTMEHDMIVKRGRFLGISLGVIAVILGVIKGSDFALLAKLSAGWIAVISTATASISAYIYAGRHQYLSISYQSTARQLEMLLARWRSLDKSDNDTQDRNEFIQECENIISIENSAWMMVQKNSG